jgi:soluble lytic murein transglycosylase-like protein
VAATIVAESSCKPSVVSKDGAVGLMQVDCHTWRTYSRTELLNPARNVEVGTTILALYVREGGSNREGLRRYFGVTPGSDQADIYADHILKIARLN